MIAAARGLDGARIRAAVEAAERRTSAEIVVSVARYFFGDVPTAARRAFARLRVAETRARHGVLIFAVPGRRQVIVLGDERVEALLAMVMLGEVAQRIAAGFGRGHRTDGLIAGIEHLADGLARCFPALAGEVDERSDAPVLT